MVLTNQLNTLTMKKQLRLTFREGNKLMKKALTNSLNPLRAEAGDYQIRSFNRWCSNQREDIKNYFTNLFERLEEIEHTQYHRPVVRGRDGHLYSQYDMDQAMMSC